MAITDTALPGELLGRALTADEATFYGGLDAERVAVNAICELCETPIVNGTAGWRHLASLAERFGCMVAEPPMAPLPDIDPALLAPVAAGPKSPACASCG